ncbi:MAG TPA: L,D-transpeptidase [Gaiellaceae bacterium]|nr:L,D-transpeptidase [Gaiellaceae bacterium]
MSGQRARLKAAVLAALIAQTIAAGTPGAAGGPLVQRLLLVDGRVAARAAPRADAAVVGAIPGRTPLTGARTVVPVLASAVGPAGGRWLRVRLPLRPNGGTGWVPAAAGTAAETPWRIVVHRAARQADVLEQGRVRATFPVVVGKPATPTPLGSFFVVEKLHLAPGVTEGPWALAISAYSNVLHEFAGGVGQVGLHGTVGLTDPLGTQASHGCVRFGVRAITWIAARVDAGTPVVVER